MTDKIMDNNPIELRSPQVRHIIGAPPPLLTRIGIYVILYISIIFVGGSALFKYTPSYNLEAELHPTQHNNIQCILYIPANITNKISVQQQVSINYNFAHLPTGTLKGQIDSISEATSIKNGTAFTLGYCTLHAPFNLTDTQQTTAVIECQSQSYLSRIIEIVFKQK